MTDTHKDQSEEHDILNVAKAVLFSLFKSFLIMAFLFSVFNHISSGLHKLNAEKQILYFLVNYFYSVVSYLIPFVGYVIPATIPASFYIRKMLVNKEPLYNWLWKSALYYFLTWTFLQSLFQGPQFILGTFIVIAPQVILGALIASYFAWRSLVYLPNKNPGIQETVARSRKLLN